MDAATRDEAPQRVWSATFTPLHPPHGAVVPAGRHTPATSLQETEMRLPSHRASRSWGWGQAGIVGHAPGTRRCRRPAAGARPAGRPDAFRGCRECPRAAAGAPYTAALQRSARIRSNAPTTLRCTVHKKPAKLPLVCPPPNTSAPATYGKCKNSGKSLTGATLVPRSVAGLVGGGRGFVFAPSTGGYSGGARLVRG